MSDEIPASPNGQPPRIEIWDSVTSACRLLFENFKIFFRLALVPIALTFVVVILGGVFWVQISYSPLIANSAERWIANTELVKLVDIGTGLFYVVFAGYLLASFAVAWHRFALFGEGKEGKFLRPRFDVRTGQYFLILGGFWVVAMVAELVLLWPTGQAGGRLIGLAFNSLVPIIAAVALSRIMLVFPSIAAELGVGGRKSIAESDGNRLRISAALVLMLLPVFFDPDGPRCPA